VAYLKRPPQPLDEDAVHAAPAPIHRDARARFGQHRDPFATRELATLIGVHDQGQAGRSSFFCAFTYGRAHTPAISASQRRSPLPVWRKVLPFE